MSASVEVAEPGMNEALESLAHLGRRIDQAVRGTTLGSMRSSRVSSSPESLSSESDQSKADVSQGSQTVDSEPPLAADAAIPGMDWLDSLARTITEALSAALLPKFEEITQSISDCCSKIAGAIADVCKCTGVPAAVTESLGRIEKSLADITDESLGDALKMAGSIAGMVAVAVGALTAALVAIGVIAASPWIIPLVAGSTAVLAAGTYLGWWWMNDQDSPDTIDQSTNEMLAGARDIENKRLQDIHPRARGVYEYQRKERLQDYVHEFESHLKRLKEIIEDPEAETDAQKHLWREEAERLLPEVRSRFEELLRLYQKLLKEPPSLDPEIEDWLDRLNGQELTPPATGHDGDSVPAPSSSLPPGFVPAASSTSGTHPNNPPSLEQPSKFDGEYLTYLMEAVVSRLREPVKLEVRVLDDRVIARRLDGNRGVDVDMTRGPRMVGYLSV